MPAKHRCQLNKVSGKRDKAASNQPVNVSRRGKSEIEGMGEKQ
jgi:hypothetical protein